MRCGESDDVCDILLVNAPWATLRSPSIQLSVLKPVLEGAGFKCHVLYTNLLLATLIEPHTYEKFQKHLLLGEWLFSPQVFGDFVPPSLGQDYLDYLENRPMTDVEHFESSQISTPRYHSGASNLLAAWYGPQFRELITQIRQQVVPRFCSNMLSIMSHHHAKFVGFTSTFNQNVPSLSFAKGLKKISDDRVIIFGGANCQDTMGLGLLDSFEFVDFVVNGEGEISLPKLLTALSNKDYDALRSLAGILYRDGGHIRNNGRSQPLVELDSFPFMDCSDYFKQLNHVKRYHNVLIQYGPIYFEGSRGCWWGQHSQCTFCGLNGNSIRYRSKSPERILRELRHLSDAYKILDFNATDNILNPALFGTLLPEIKEDGIDFRIFFEVKTALTKDQIRLLSESGVKFVQPGIESLSTHVLRIMKKGTTMLQNVQALKWFEEYDIFPQYGLICGFPGESPEDYISIETLLPSLYHLPPPLAIRRIEMQRFSPNFEFAEELGFRDVEPLIDYSFVYNLDENRLRNVANLFEYELVGGFKFSRHIRIISEMIEAWTTKYFDRVSRNKLSYRIGPGFVQIDDKRGESALRLTLTGLSKEILLYCDRIRTFDEITTHFKVGSTTNTKNHVLETTEALLTHGILIHEEGRYLSLPVAVK